MSINSLSRRRFILQTLKSSGFCIASSGIAGTLTSCGGDDGTFEHGVASGDPLSDSVIIWTRVTPLKPEHTNSAVTVFWQVATDPEFNQVVVSGSAKTTAERDYTLKVDIGSLQPATQYYYRFLSGFRSSPVGFTKTLPEGEVTSTKLAVVSCSNYPAGYFHVYNAIAQRTDLDAVLHLGDYIYEYARGEYASENAAALNREVLPETEILSLADYRARYAQYRSDPDLQAAHHNQPFICVWDDHEITNDAWRNGAENHQENEGPYATRLQAALQAYAEWMPVRPPVDSDIAALARNFQFGNLVNLNMLDTRLVARDKQLQLSDYFDADGTFNAAAYGADIGDPERSLLGQDQRSWLQHQLTTPAKWQVLGQQVLMGTMELPAAVVTQQLSIAEFAELAQLAQLAQTNPEALSEAQRQLLAEKGPLLQLGNLPYNLDAWDGYPAERAALLASAQQIQGDLVVLAGDTHNAWANNLRLNDEAVGVEFATSSVSSPGLESFLGLTTPESVAQTESALTQLIPNLQYANLSDRGYLSLSFSPSEVRAEWIFVSNIQDTHYDLLAERNQSLTVAHGSKQISTS